MLNRNVFFKALFSVSLFLLVAGTACGEASSEIDNSASENSQTPITTPEAAPVDGELAADDAVGAPTERLADVVLSLAGDGVFVTNEQSGNTQAIPFGTNIATSQAAVSSILGDPTETTQNNECGAGPMSFITWSNGFTMNAMQDQFVGWTVRPDTESADLTTMDGIGLGKTLADLEANYSVDVIESTLGTEFNASDSLFGLLSANEPNGVIINLWSGIACNFR